MIDSHASTIFVICTSIASSVLLIFSNKYLMDVYKFRYVFTLTGLHFLFGGLSLKFISVVFNTFETKGMPLLQRFLVGASGVGSIALMNFSLQTNSVGTYQLMKLLVIPTVMVIQYVTAGTSSPLQEKLCLMVLLLGVGISTVTDVSLSTVGLVFGIVSVVATAQFNIWQGSKQKVRVCVDVRAPFARLCVRPRMTPGLNLGQRPHAPCVVMFHVEGCLCRDALWCGPGAPTVIDAAAVRDRISASTDVLRVGGHL